MFWRNDKKERPGVNSPGSWTDSNTKKSVFIISGLLKGESSRIRHLKIVGILLALTLGIAAVILISTQSQRSPTQNAVVTDYNPLLDPNCSNCTCFAFIDLVLDITTDLTPDAFTMQNEFVNYYISKLYDPQFLEDGSQVIIDYGIDGGDFGIKWPTLIDNRTLQEYVEDGDILRKKQAPGKFNDLYNILLGIFLKDFADCPHEFLDYCDSSFPKNNIVFMGSPSKTIPPDNNLDLTQLAYKLYNGTREINLTNYYFHGLTGRNNFIVILMKNDTYEKWNKTNLQKWLDAGLHVLQYKNDNEQLLYELRTLLSCVYSPNQTYINLPDIKKTSLSNVKFTLAPILNDSIMSETSTTKRSSKHWSSTKKQN